MITLHSTAGYLLEGRITNHTIAGTSVELFVTHPNAQRPRAQRIACLTLPAESLSRIAELFTAAADASLIRDSSPT